MPRAAVRAAMEAGNKIRAPLSTAHLRTEAIKFADERQKGKTRRQRLRAAELRRMLQGDPAVGSAQCGSGGLYLPRAKHAGRFNAALVPDIGKISVFKVRLRCEAAPKIGCGVRAKPVLQDLECVPGIREAWLSRDGNLIAVVRAVTGRRTKGTDPARAAFRKHRIAVETLRGKRLANALKDFASQSGWHRAAEVDRLSEEEARIIAARLVARLRARAALPELRAR